MTAWTGEREHNPVSRRQTQPHKQHVFFSRDGERGQDPIVPSRPENVDNSLSTSVWHRILPISCSRCPIVGVCVRSTRF